MKPMSKEFAERTYERIIWNVFDLAFLVITIASPQQNIAPKKTILNSAIKIGSSVI